jgi:hypothetical protein
LNTFNKAIFLSDFRPTIKAVFLLIALICPKANSSKAFKDFQPNNCQLSRFSFNCANSMAGEPAKAKSKSYTERKKFANRIPTQQFGKNS